MLKSGEKRKFLGIWYTRFCCIPYNVKMFYFQLIYFTASTLKISIGDNFRQMRRLLKIRVDGQQQRFVTVGQLFASHVKVESSGLFTCVSENKAGSESQSMHLYIHPKPQPGCEYLITLLISSYTRSGTEL